jgi:hypothetical protein
VQVQAMPSPFDYPVFVLVFCLSAFWSSAWVGFSLRRRHLELAETTYHDLDFVLGGALTLLGLIIGFSFSMALSRYDQRKNYEEAEANAIGTEYLRVNLLPSADAAKVHALLKSYLEQRVQYYETRNRDDLRQIDRRTAELQTELWLEASSSATALPAPITTFVLGGMNDVLNTQGYTQAAWWNRIPHAAWFMMISIAIFCNLFVGYASHGRSRYLFFVLPIALSIALFLMADIDSPRAGIIRVHAQNLESLDRSLQSQ